VAYKESQLNIRVTQGDKQKIKWQAKKLKMNQSEYLRFASDSLDLKNAYALVEISETLALMHKELVRQGVNLNQIAHLYNTYGVERDAHLIPLLKRSIEQTQDSKDQIDGAAIIVKEALAQRKAHASKRELR